MSGFVEEDIMRFKTINELTEDLVANDPDIFKRIPGYDESKVNLFAHMDGKLVCVHLEEHGPDDSTAPARKS